jgi:exonuclease 3'-5' domain-containing protein 1
MSRYGSVSILKIYVLPLNCFFLIDAHTLGKAVFLEPGGGRITPKRILEDKHIPKVFFDV